MMELLSLKFDTIRYSRSQNVENKEEENDEMVKTKKVMVKMVLFEAIFRSKFFYLYICAKNPRGN